MEVRMLRRDCWVLDAARRDTTRVMWCVSRARMSRGVVLVTATERKLLSPRKKAQPPWFSATSLGARREQCRNSATIHAKGCAQSRHRAPLQVHIVNYTSPALAHARRLALRCALITDPSLRTCPRAVGCS